MQIINIRDLNIYKAQEVVMKGLIDLQEELDKEELVKEILQLEQANLRLYHLSNKFKMIFYLVIKICLNIS